MRNIRSACKLQPKALDINVGDQIEGYPLKPGHPKVSMGYEQQADEPFLANEVHPFAQPTLQKGQGIGC